MFKSGPFALCFPLFLAVCRCAVNSEETALKLKDIKPETSGIEENSDWNEGKNIKHTGENNGVRELNDGMQRGPATNKETNDWSNEEEEFEGDDEGKDNYDNEAEDDAENGDQADDHDEAEHYDKVDDQDKNESFHGARDDDEAQGAYDARAAAETETKKIPETKIEELKDGTMQLEGRKELLKNEDPQRRRGKIPRGRGGRRKPFRRSGRGGGGGRYKVGRRGRGRSRGRRRRGGKRPSGRRPTSHRMCGSLLLNPTYSVCCKGFINDKVPNARCCETRVYDSSKEKCCIIGGILNPWPRRRSCPMPRRRCGGKPFHFRNQVCCKGVISRKVPNARCCETKVYDALKEKCCIIGGPVSRGRSCPGRPWKPLPS